ncbi:MAG: YcbK family protein [Candidatus Binatia bacterium]
MWGRMKGLGLCAFWIAVLTLFAAGEVVPGTQMQPVDRYFLSGDGRINLKNAKTNRSASIRYRLPSGAYPQEAQEQIDRLFGVGADEDEHISLRLISALDYIEDQYRIPIVVISGFRSAKYNDNLRAKGGGAAKASLHIEGMAADLRVRKKLARKIWNDVKEMHCCGIGFYGGDSLHVDTGPARFWTQATSKVRTNISENNKLIMARTDQDIYLPGEKITLKLARITAYPVYVSPIFSIVSNGGASREFSFDRLDTACQPVREPAERTFAWTIPRDVSPEGKVQVQLRFCEKQFPEMPDQIESNVIEVRATR